MRVLVVSQTSTRIRHTLRLPPPCLPVSVIPALYIRRQTLALPACRTGETALPETLYKLRLRVILQYLVIRIRQTICIHPSCPPSRRRIRVILHIGECRTPTVCMRRVLPALYPRRMRVIIQRQSILTRLFARRILPALYPRRMRVIIQRQSILVRIHARRIRRTQPPILPVLRLRSI